MRTIHVRNSLLRCFLIVSLLMNIVLLFCLIHDNIHHEESIVDIDQNNSLLPVETQQMLIEKLIESGSKETYDKLFNLYLDEKESGEFLPWALIMANKWDSPYDGMYDVYRELLDMYNLEFNNIDLMDSITRDMALSYLIRAYETSEDSVERKIMFDPDIDYYIKEGYIKECEGKLLISK